MILKRFVRSFSEVNLPSNGRKVRTLNPNSFSGYSNSTRGDSNTAGER
jgi:hypothetical protein